MPIVCALVPEYRVALARLDHPVALRTPDHRRRQTRTRPRARALPAGVRTRRARRHDARASGGVRARSGRRRRRSAARPRAMGTRARRARRRFALDRRRGRRRGLSRDARHRGLRKPVRRKRARRVRGRSRTRGAAARRGARAPNKFVARAAALVRDGTIVRAGDERAFVAPLPLRFLGLDRATIERLELFGVTNLRTLAALPHGPFVRRFGAEAARWHARAGGVDDEPLVPRTRHITIDRSLFGEGTAEREDQLLFALRTLVARVAEDLACAGKRCGALAARDGMRGRRTHRAADDARATDLANRDDVRSLARAARRCRRSARPSWVCTSRQTGSKKAAPNSRSLRAAIPIPTSSASRSHASKRRSDRARRYARASSRATGTRRAWRTNPLPRHTSRGRRAPRSRRP